MTVKQKVTLYIPDDLHRQFKIRSAVDGETMSAMAQRAIEFYLAHADVVEGIGEVHGQTHRLHSCPRCSAAVAVKDGELSLIGEQGSRGLSDHAIGDLAGLDQVTGLRPSAASPGEGELVTC